MCIAGAIVRDTVFSKVEQYLTVVEDSSCLDAMASLCQTLNENGVVVCGGGIKGLEIIQREAVKRGWQAESGGHEGTVRISIGSHKLWLLAEVDAPDCKPLTLHYVETDDPDEEEFPVPMPGGYPGERALTPTSLRVRRAAAELEHHRTAGFMIDGDNGGQGGKGKGGKGGKGGKRGQVEAQPKDELPVAATIALPPEMAEAGLIFVTNGHLLRETASLSSVICRVCGRGRSIAPVPMFHLVTDIRQVLLETEDQLRAVAAALASDGRMNTTVELPEQSCVPSGAVLLAEGMLQGSSQVLPDAAQLPAILNFKLRMTALGLITRLRDRYGCTISEIFYNILSSLLKQNI